MINRIENFICELLLDNMKELFFSNPAIKKIELKYIEDNDFVTRSILLTIEKKIKCPDGQFLISDEQKEIAHSSTRNAMEIDFANAIKGADEFLKLVFGNYHITMNREDVNFEAKYV